MALTNEEFTKCFFAEFRDIRRIKLAISEGRYTIWTRRDKPNFPDEYLMPILLLPDSHRVRRKKRKSEGEGLAYIIELQYNCRVMGKLLPVYLKGYFTKKGQLMIAFEIQSLRANEERD